MLEFYYYRCFAMPDGLWPIIILIAIAANDDERSPNEKTVLRESFAAAGVSAEIEVYGGALHGWCIPDSGVYHEAQAERAWGRMLALFEENLS